MQAKYTTPHQAALVAFDINPTGVSLAEIFAACISCLDTVTGCMKAQRHPDAMKFSLLRLRLSRLGDCHKIYQGPGSESHDPADELKAKYALSALLTLLEVENSTCEKPVSGERNMPSKVAIHTGSSWLLEKIDAMSVRRSPAVKRLPTSVRLTQYQGQISWSMQQFEKAVEIIGGLEDTLGSSDLRESSSAERWEIEQDSRHGPEAVSCLATVAEGVDEWVASWAGINRSYDNVSLRVCNVLGAGRSINIMMDAPLLGRNMNISL